MRLECLTPGLVCLLAASGAAQELTVPGDPLATGLTRWAHEFEAGRIDPVEDFGKDLAVYGPLVQTGGLLLRYRSSAQTFSHQRMLERMVDAAETSPSSEALRGLLEVAGVGLDHSPFDAEVRIVRDLGRHAAVRVVRAVPGFGPVVRDVAAGVELDDLYPDVGAQVGALRLLGELAGEENVAALVLALDEPDPRLRLAAVEALQRCAAADSLGAIVALLGEEGHPVVSQALVAAVGVVLDAHVDDLPAEAREGAIATALARIGAAGWRTDVEVVDLVGRHPTRAAVPVLIDVLDGILLKRRRARDRDFATLLRERAWAALRRATGTLLPLDDADAWRAFWAEHGEDIEIVSRPPPRTEGRTTSGGFYGIRVRGRESSFVLDVSRSMRARTGPHRRGPSRLDVAQRQLLEAAQDMPRSWRFRVLTFDDEVRVWNARGARADGRTMRALTAFLQRQRPGGRTDLLAGLRVALGVDALRFGQEARSPVDEIFLLSDGLPASADGPQDPEDVLAAIRAFNRYQKVRIHAVMVGTGKEGSAFLRRLAEENGGDFVQG